MSDGGRDLLGGSERLVRLLAALEAAGPAGVGQERLAEVGGYGGEPDVRRSALTREISDLTQAGWTIENVAGPGERARYALRARDTRLRIGLTRRQQAELSRAAQLADAQEPVFLTTTPPVDVVLSRCVSAVAVRASVRFGFRGTTRTVHPRAVRPGPAGWYVVGCEDGRTGERWFAIDLISDLTVGEPGTAAVPSDARDGRLDPASWLVDPPEEVTVETSREFADQVVRALGPLMRRTDRTDRTDRVLLTFPVTHQAAFRMRLYPLGTRVRVVAPAHVRAAIRAELTDLAASS
jgi:WYL domain